MKIRFILVSNQLKEQRKREGEKKKPCLAQCRLFATSWGGLGERFPINLPPPPSCAYQRESVEDPFSSCSSQAFYCRIELTIRHSLRQPHSSSVHLYILSIFCSFLKTAHGLVFVLLDYFCLFCSEKFCCTMRKHLKELSCSWCRYVIQYICTKKVHLYAIRLFFY